MRRVDVVVPSWNVRELLRAALTALLASRDVELEVVVVDDASSDGSAEMVEAEFPRVRLVRNARNAGFAASTNRGAALGRAPLLLLLNADTEVAPDAIAVLAAYLEASPQHAAAAPRLVSPDGSTQRACMAFPKLATALWFGTPLERWRPHSRELERYFLRAFDHADERDVEQPPAACLLLRRADAERVAPAPGVLLDERFGLYFNDVDLSLRLARAGLRTRYLPQVRVVHHVGASTTQHPQRLLQWHSDRVRFYRAHFGWWAAPWVKACVGWTLLDHSWQQLRLRLRGRPRQAVVPLWRDYGALLCR